MRPLALCLLDPLTPPRWPRPGSECDAPPVSASTPVGLKAQGSADYIHLYSGDKDTLTESLDHIQRVSAEIVSAITTGD